MFPVCPNLSTNAQRTFNLAASEVLSPEQCRGARGLLGWSQAELASAAAVAVKTIADFEGFKRSPYPRTLRDIRLALEQAGIVLIAADGAGPGVRLRFAP